MTDVVAKTIAQELEVNGVLYHIAMQPSRLTLFQDRSQRSAISVPGHRPSDVMLTDRQCREAFNAIPVLQRQENGWSDLLMFASQHRFIANVGRYTLFYALWKSVLSPEDDYRCHYLQFRSWQSELKNNVKGDPTPEIVWAGALKLRATLPALMEIAVLGTLQMLAGPQ